MASEIGVAEVGPELIKLWNRLHEILDEDGDQAWEEDGGRRREFSDTGVELHAKLGLRPWEAQPIAASDPDPPAWMCDAEQRADYARAHRLYEVLEAAANAAKQAARGRSARRRPSASATARSVIKAEAREP